MGYGIIENKVKQNDGKKRTGGSVALESCVESGEQ
jgi:hypothetical protein